LACPLIRVVSGDRAVARPATPCTCGRGLQRIGPIDGRVAETLFDGAGNPTSGLIFSIMFVWLGKVTKQFQVVQRVDRSVVLRVVPLATTLSDADRAIARDYFAKYLPGTTLEIAEVTEIPLTKAGKVRVVINEALTPNKA
jgi:phenylacetate-coenzyme A ligase PaaK-like adenylate-forming protein